MLWWLPFVMRGCSVHMGSHTRLGTETQVWAARPRTQPIMRTRSYKLSQLSYKLSLSSCHCQAARPRTQPIMRTRSSLCVSPGWVSAGVREFSFHHNITSKHWQSRSRLPSSADNCPFIWSRKLFTNSPGNWKTATVSTQTGFRGGGESYQKLILKLASNRSRLWAETPGGIILFMKSWDSERVGARVPSWDLRAGLITCH